MVSARAKLISVVGFLLLPLYCESSNMSLFKLKQFINVPGVKVLSTVLCNPAVAIPNIQIETLKELDLHRLQQKGIKCLVFDKDNTLRYIFLA